VRKLCCIWVGLCLLGCFAALVHAETFQLNDGRTLSGEVVSFDENGLIVRLPDGKYSEREPWTGFAQADLRKLAENSKITAFVEPFIEITAEERLKRTEVELNPPLQRLQRPPPRSLLGSLFTSSVGVLVLLALYAANLYAAYEVSIFRARPVALVCGVSAVAPLIGPLVFFFMPTAGDQAEAVDAPPEAPAVIRPFAVPGTHAPAPAREAARGTSVRVAPEAGPATTAIPQTQIFQRGAFTFNRRFFETKFSGFFGVIKRDADKEMVLVIRSARGHFVAQRISRIAANELHVHVQKGSASEEVLIPFSEIQEVQLKHVSA
jgi:hypothetical protein